jgi:hypothetical protein
MTWLYFVFVQSVFVFVGRPSPWENPEVARRVMEVRTAYASQDFEWDITRGLVVKAMEKSNADILKNHLVETFRRSEEKTQHGAGGGVDEY